MRVDAETLGLFALRVVLGILWLAILWRMGPPPERPNRADRRTEWADPFAGFYFLCWVALMAGCALSSFWG